MAEQQQQTEGEDEAEEFHVKVRERRGSKHVRTRKGTTHVTIRRSATIDSQQAAEEHVAKHSPGLEVLGAADAPAPEEGAAPVAGTTTDAGTGGTNTPPPPSPALEEATGLAGSGPSPQAVS